MHEALHPTDDIDRPNVSRRDGEEDLPTLKTILTPQNNDLKTTEKRGRRLIAATRNKD